MKRARSHDCGEQQFQLLLLLPLTLLLPLLLLLLCCSPVVESRGNHSHGARQTYIISVAASQKPTVFATAQQWHTAMLPSPHKLLYSYKSAYAGFAARLTPREAKKLRHRAGVRSVQPQKMYRLHTTRTPEFLGMAAGGGLLAAAGDGRGAIIGVLDTGANPESPSLGDAGMEPAPARWKGECDGGSRFKCNNKIIGARVFGTGAGVPASRANAIDVEGHGSHTASTAAGAAVPGASVFGFANGTAHGMAPRAWLAVYKVCFPDGCASSDILAAIDAAIADGVDVLSMSLGGSAADYRDDAIAVGAFAAAAQKGIFVSASAGNSGPDAASVSNVAPWITTVAASTLDRRFPGVVTLGDGSEHGALSVLFSGPAMAPRVAAPLVYARDHPSNDSDADSAAACGFGTLQLSALNGTVVLCDGAASGTDISFDLFNAGAAGAIFINTGEPQDVRTQLHPFPAAQVGAVTGDAIKKYLAGAKAATARIDATALTAAAMDAMAVPAVAPFSSRGPNLVTQGVLKPDVMAPGVDIVAAWAVGAPPTASAGDNRTSAFNMISGTSMSCPHVSGLAALLRVAHPDWSPAAVRSALMTTATPLDRHGNAITDLRGGRPATPFDYGAGHVRPERALDPGLIYDLRSDDYARLLCALNYSDADLQAVVRDDKSTCAGLRGSGSGSDWTVNDFNYPSFSAVVGSGRTRVTLRRQVTHVGSSGPAATYRAKVEMPAETERAGVNVTVEPWSLAFSGGGTPEKLSFSVTVTVPSLPTAPLFAWLLWSDRDGDAGAGGHSVRSPIVISTVSTAPR